MNPRILDLKRWLLAGLVPLGLMALSLLLAACGGGGGSATSAASSATTGSSAAVAKEVASGTVTGFGSTYVEGRKYEDNSASVLIEDDPSSPRSGTTADIKLGAQVVTKSSDGSSASTIIVRSEVIGKITSLAADGFVVAGVTVKVSGDVASPTVFDGVSGLSALAVNDFVEVYGQRDASNNLVASRVELRDPASVVFTKVSGTIAGLDSTNKRFTLGGLTVTYDKAVRLLPSAADLADGKRVAVWSDVAISSNTLVAKSLVVRSADSSSGDTARMGGRIQGLDFAGKLFTIDGVSIDASAASFVGGTASDLANGRRVRVTGVFANNAMKASEVRFVKDQGDALVDITGGITDFVSSASFKLRGVPVDASASTITWSNGDASNLGNFVVVQIKGSVVGDVVLPTEVKFITSSSDVNRAFVGTVAGYDSGSGAFNLLNVGMKLLGTTTFTNADGSAATRADFGNGDAVAVKGSFVSGTFEVSAVTFRPASNASASAVINWVEGSAGSVDLAGGRFRLNGQTVRFGSSTQLEGLLSSLRNGAKVEVSGRLVGGELVATRLEIKPAKGAETSELRGAITGFVSTADFKVGTVSVDASAASFDNGTAADLGNGDFVEVRGSVVNGVLKATQVKFRS